MALHVTGSSDLLGPLQLVKCVIFKMLLRNKKVVAPDLIPDSQFCVGHSLQPYWPEGPSIRSLEVDTYFSLTKLWKDEAISHGGYSYCNVNPWWLITTPKDISSPANSPWNNSILNWSGPLNYGWMKTYPVCYDLPVTSKIMDETVIKLCLVNNIDKVYITLLGRHDIC